MYYTRKLFRFRVLGIHHLKHETATLIDLPFSLTTSHRGAQWRDLCVNIVAVVVYTFMPTITWARHPPHPYYTRGAATAVKFPIRLSTYTVIYNSPSFVFLSLSPQLDSIWRRGSDAYVEQLHTTCTTRYASLWDGWLKYSYSPVVTMK